MAQQPPPITPATDVGEAILLQAQRIVDLVEKRAASNGWRVGVGSVSILLHALALKAAHAAGRMEQDKLEAGADELAANLKSAMLAYHAQFAAHQQLLDTPTPPVEKAN